MGMPTLSRMRVGGCARAAAVAVDGDDVRTAARDAAGDRRRVVYRRDLDDDRLFVLGRLFEGVDQLFEVFNGIDIVMGSGRDRVHALRDHARFGYVLRDLGARQVPADARLCALAHLDLDGGSRLEVFLMDAESAGCDLYDGIFAVAVEVAVQAALAGVVVNAQFFRCPREALVRVVADRAVAHRREQDGDGQFQLRRECIFQAALLVALDLGGALPQPKLRLHRLAQRVDGRVGHLRCIQEQFVPKYRVGFGVAHGGEEDAARIRLAVDLVDGLHAPVGIFAVGVVRLDDLERVRGAQAHAAVAVDALAVVRAHLARCGVIFMDAVGALSFADAAGDAFIGIADHFVVRADIQFHQSRLPYSS